MGPPKLRIHNTSSGKLKSISKTVPSPPHSQLIQPSTSTGGGTQSKNIDQEEAERQFEIELYWCIQQLEISLNSGKLNPKQLQDTEKNVKILKSPTQMLIKKRQLMRTLFGDYRNKMVDEEKKMYSANGKIKFTKNPQASKKSFFVKKSALLKSGKEFRFNFELEKLKISDDDSTKLDNNINSTVEQESQKIVPSNNSFRFNFNINELQNSDS